MQRSAPTEVELNIHPLHEIPFFNEDLESETGFPVAVQSLRDAVRSCDGLLLSSPEYNNSMSAVLKNAIDWVSRAGPNKERLLAGKHVAVMGATTSMGGTILGQASYWPVLRALNARAWFGPRLYVSGADKVFDLEGNLTDESIKNQVHGYLAGFVKEIGKG